MSSSNNQAALDLIQAVLDAESTLSNLLNKNQITGIVTRAPLEKLIASIQFYRQTN